MPKHAKPILDLITRREYSSMYKAGQELATLVGGDPKNRLVWFAVQRAFPNRFQTKDLQTGKWVALTAAPRTTHVTKTVNESSAPSAEQAPAKSDAQDKALVAAKAGTASVVNRAEPAPRKTAKAPKVKSKTKPTPKKEIRFPKSSGQAVR